MTSTPKPPHREQEFLTAQQAADLIGLSRRTIYAYCLKGAHPQIPHRRWPGRTGKILIRREDLLRWFDIVTEQHHIIRDEKADEKPENPDDE